MENCQETSPIVIEVQDECIQSCSTSNLQSQLSVKPKGTSSTMLAPVNGDDDQLNHDYNASNKPLAIVVEDSQFESGLI